MTEEKETGNQASTHKAQKKLSVGHVLTGGILGDDFVLKQTKLLFLIAILFVVLIANRYVCLTKISEIDRLTEELKSVKYEHLVISTELTTNSRQSQIEALVEAKGLGLTGSKKPPYKLEK